MDHSNEALVHVWSCSRSTGCSEPSDPHFLFLFTAVSRVQVGPVQPVKFRDPAGRSQALKSTAAG